MTLKVPYRCSALLKLLWVTGVQSFALCDNIVDLFLWAPKADDTIAFTWGQELSTSGSNTSCPQDGCQVIVALVIKVEEMGWGCELLPETRNYSSSTDQMDTTLQPHRTKKLYLFFLDSLSVSLTHSDLIFFSFFSHDICITHAFLLNANQLFSLSVLWLPQVAQDKAAAAR